MHNWLNVALISDIDIIHKFVSKKNTGYKSQVVNYFIALWEIIFQC